MELGLYSFAETNPGPEAVGQSISDLLEEIELADQVGLDVYGVGEHHRVDYAVSSPAVVLAAAAVRTKRIRLSSAVTVLSSDDPVRVFQSFATLDLISQGRAEIMVGRGSFIESFPLFGYSLDDYDELFTERRAAHHPSRDQAERAVSVGDSVQYQTGDDTMGPPMQKRHDRGTAAAPCS
jgi:alkanesulfonate monooxygenase SsuD/methylene tetrahydromethanopterin reductase-like flavin-dependent oxidoreductase (luciferase family)